MQFTLHHGNRDHLENDLNVVCLENTKNFTTYDAFAGPLHG